MSATPLGSMTEGLRRAPAAVIAAVWLVAGVFTASAATVGVVDHLDRVERDVSVIVARVAELTDRPEPVIAWQDAVRSERPQDPIPEFTSDPPPTPDTSTRSQVLQVQGAGELNLRGAPNLDARVVARLPEGSSYTATGRTHTADDIEWVELELTDGETGWASSRYLGPAG